MKALTNIPLLSIQRSSTLLALKLPERSFSLLCKLDSSVPHTNPDEWTDTPEYPACFDPSLTARHHRKKQEWYDKINSLPTCEQKLMEMNMPRYYGHACVPLDSNYPRLSGMNFVRYVTRTHIENQIPDEYYADVEGKAEEVSKETADEVEHLILTHFGTDINRHLRGNRLMRPVRLQTGNFLKDLAYLATGVLSRKSDDIDRLEIDAEPRIEGAWLVGGFAPAPHLKRSRENTTWRMVDPDLPGARWMRSSTRPSIGIRSLHPLPNVVEQDHSLALKKDEIVVQDSTHCGFARKHRRLVIVPGYWPGCINEHGHLFIHSREFLMRFSYTIPHQEIINSLLEQSLLMSAFTQAQSHAFYQGFTPFNEMSFPLVQQTFSTDGQFWKFVLYQLNACNLIDTDTAHNPYNNVMWMGDDVKLYDCIEDGKVKGLNLDVLKMVFKMFLKEGRKREEEYPYEKVGYRFLKDHNASEEFKEHFLGYVHRITSERHQHEPRNELFHYQRIYGITDQLFKNKRRDWYNSRYGWKPWERRFDDFEQPYIPKDLRASIRIKKHPKLDSEKLFVLDRLSIRKAKLTEGDKELSSMNQTDVKYTRKSFMKYMTVREIKK